MTILGAGQTTAENPMGTFFFPWSNNAEKAAANANVIDTV